MRAGSSGMPRRQGRLGKAPVTAGQRPMRTLRCASAPGVEPGRSQPERGQQRRRTTASFLRLRRLRLFLAPRSPVLAHPFGDRLALFLGHRALAPGDGPDRLLPAAPGGWRADSCDRLDGALYGDELALPAIAPRCAARPGFRSSTSRPASSEATRRRHSAGRRKPTNVLRCGLRPHGQRRYRADAPDSVAASAA